MKKKKIEFSVNVLRYFSRDEYSTYFLTQYKYSVLSIL